MRKRERQKPRQLLPVFGLHNNQIGDSAQKRNIKNTMVGRTIFTNQSGPVHRDYHGELLETDIMNDLIDSPLEKCRVDRHHRLQSLGRHPRRKGEGMSFRDSDIKELIGKFFRERG